MISFAQLLSVSGMFLVPLAVLFWRVEHRLTKIETDINWIRALLDKLCSEHDV